MNLLEGDAFNRGSGWGGGEREEVGPPHGPGLCTLREKGDTYPRWCVVVGRWAGLQCKK